MPKPKVLFTAEQFTTTPWDTAADKAKFANHFVRFVEGGFKATVFPKWFYNRLSMTFGHIAHYNLNGFYDAQFSSTEKQLAFLRQTFYFPTFGDPAYTYTDVELALATWVQEQKLLDYYRRKLDAEVEQAERTELARLAFKYGGKA